MWQSLNILLFKLHTQNKPILLHQNRFANTSGFQGIFFIFDFLKDTPQNI
jgi:hypothetical protein